MPQFPFAPMGFPIELRVDLESYDVEFSVTSVIVA